MTKYIIRQVGWVYDDSEYIEEKYQKLEGIYDNYEKALERKRYLNELAFISNFDSIKNFNIGISDEFYLYLIHELGVNPSVALLPSFSIDIFPEIPSYEQLINLIEILNIDFFHIVEVENEIIFYHAYMNFPYKKYLCDIDGKEILFTSLSEAINQFYITNCAQEVINYIKNKPLKELSNTPDLFKNFLTTHPKIKTKKGIITDFLETLYFEDILPLNGFLKIPFIELEEIERQDDFFISNDEINLLEETGFNEWEWIEKRRNAYWSIETMKKTNDYQSMFYINLQDYNYSKIIKNYFSQYIKYDPEKFSFKALIIDLRKKDDLYIVSSSCFIDEKKLDTNKIGVGEGSSIEISFCNSLQNFLDQHGLEWVEKIKKLG